MSGPTDAYIDHAQRGWWAARDALYKHIEELAKKNDRLRAIIAEWRPIVAADQRVLIHGGSLNPGGGSLSGTTRAPLSPEFQPDRVDEELDR